jgi:Na+/melibiose symporter-like transporter
VDVALPTPEAQSGTAGLSSASTLRYGLMGFALAFVALPLYVLLPHYYASNFGLPLATLGGLLLAGRMLDALLDPFLGRGINRLLYHSPTQTLTWAAGAALALAAGFASLWFPLWLQGDALLLNLSVSLLLTYLAFSALTIGHQSWGALLGGDEVQRALVVAWREGLGLAGVLVASIAGTLWDIRISVALLWLALPLAWWGWRSGPQPAALPPEPVAQAQRRSTPLADPAFRALLAVFMLNGIASALPATLMLFFVQDLLQAPANMQAVFLAAYFVCGALGMALWLPLVARWGLLRSWLTGMLLACTVFSLAATLGPGDVWGFAAVCAASGFALGSDLALPGAMLAGITQRARQHQGAQEGAYFGWWACATKLNLALAAGLALPALAAWGYAPGAQDPQALRALTWAYCLLPCGLKLAAAGLLVFFHSRKTL